MKIFNHQLIDPEITYFKTALTSPKCLSRKIKTLEANHKSKKGEKRDVATLLETRKLQTNPMWGNPNKWDAMED